MLRTIAVITILFLFSSTGLKAQGNYCEFLKTSAGTDILSQDGENIISLRILEPADNNIKLVFCPAGIERSSANDVKRKFPFMWTVKYNNIYWKNGDNIVFEGMNEHGFSASLMFLYNSLLPEKDKEHIPIAASLCVNFFIDHFKCIDTALLAVWDIRIFDDVGLDCGWPFRIVLHDSTGATAYIEYINGHREVYTPEPPAIAVDGPKFSRLITIKHLQDSLPRDKAELRFLSIDQAMKNEKNLENLQDLLMSYARKEGSLIILKRHSNAAYKILSQDNDDRDIEFDEAEFTAGREISRKLFD